MPKDLLKSIVCRIGMTSDTRNPPQTAPKPGHYTFVHRPQPAGLKQDDEEHDDTKSHLPSMGGVFRGVGANELKRNGAEEWSRDTGIAPQQRDENELSRL